MTTGVRTRVSEVEGLPALMTTEEFAALVGYCRTYISRMCAKGTLPATKVGKEWRIPTRKALAQLGIEC